MITKVKDNFDWLHFFKYYFILPYYSYQEFKETVILWWESDTVTAYAQIFSGYSLSK